MYWLSIRKKYDFTIERNISFMKCQREYVSSLCREKSAIWLEKIPVLRRKEISAISVEEISTIYLGTKS